MFLNWQMENAVIVIVMGILLVRPPCTSLSADPSSHTSLVVLNNVLNDMKQVNKQHRGPSVSDWDQKAEDAPDRTRRRECVGGQ